jgi:hypothetical protein
MFDLILKIERRTIGEDRIIERDSDLKRLNRAVNRSIP